LALHKEWLLPFARAVYQNRLTGPAYSIGDQQTLFTYRYALKRLKAAGFLVNPDVKPTPDHCRAECLSFRSLVAMLGIEDYQDIDINGLAGLRIDMSQSLPTEMFGRAASVFELGTLEHIFDIAEGFRNIHRLLMKGGTVIHCAPVTMYEHGFYNLNPLLFRDFYRANQYEIVDHGMILAPFQPFGSAISTLLRMANRRFTSDRAPVSWFLDETMLSFRYFNNFIFQPTRMNFFFAARKTIDSAETVLPTQV
jgi:hypothetical protein